MTPALLFLLAVAALPTEDLPPLSGDDFRHGAHQFQRMIVDRPELAELLVEDDPLRTWVVARLAGSATGFRIWWDERLPPRGIEARHGLEPRPVIRVHPVYQSGPWRGTRKTPQDLWADLVYELHNIAQAPRFRAVWQQVLDGELSQAGWLEAASRIEHRALLYTAAFYRTRWRIWMRRREAEPWSRRWGQISAVPVRYADWIRRYEDPGDYPWANYGRAWREVMRELRPIGADWRVNPFEYRILEGGGARREPR